MLGDWKWSQRYQSGVFFQLAPQTRQQFSAILSGLSEVFRLKRSGSELWRMCVIHSHSFVFAMHLLERWRDVCRDQVNAGIYACLYLTRLLFEEALPRSPSPHGGFINVICKSMPFCFGFDLWWICPIYLLCIFVLFSICVHVRCMHLSAMLYTLMHLQLYMHTHTVTHWHVMLNSAQWTLTGPWLELMKNYINGGCWSLD